MLNWEQIIERDPTILLSEKRLRALLGDAYMSDRLSVNILMDAYDIGIVAEVRKNHPVDKLLSARWAKQLTSNYGISDEKATWAIDTWLSVLSTSMLKNLDAAEQNAKKDEEVKQKKLEEEAARAAEAERLRVKQEEEKKKEELRNRPDKRLNIKTDYGDYYTNPILNESAEYIYVPCGFGQADNGFLIYGIPKENICTHPDANVFALVYNYLVRNSVLKEEDFPKVIREAETVYELDYQSIYRLSIILLMMIRHNLVHDNTISIKYSEDAECLKYAVRLINHYAAWFCQLMHISIVRLQVRNAAGAKSVSLRKRANIYVKDNTKIISNAREIWYGRKINYHLTKNDLPVLENILSEISPFDTFKEGQFSALCDMLSCKGHAVCIMPTGSGKSLIFYLASLLQPLPIFVVSPIDILIQDQIRNLKKFHRIDNVAHLQLTDSNSFSNWDIHNSLNYLTPMTFQNRHLLVKFRYLNKGTKLCNMREERIAQGSLVSYVVLDEIHCLSNWGHDFRPEYLMLSKYLNKFFDHISFWGFTATANYTVVEDIQKQLSIPQDNFFSPISFERFNVSYYFKALPNEEAMLEEICAITEPIISKGERTIVFTKNDAISEKVAEAIGFEADIFSKADPAAYYHFADGKCKILVASDDLGIGVNLPNVRNVIHFGLPLSKNEYVQEIGRAGRSNEKVKSFVLFLTASLENVPEALLRRDTPIKDLPQLLFNRENDYVDIYRKLSNGAISDETLYHQLLDTYNDFVQQDKSSCVISYPLSSIEKAKQHLYMLYLVGYINDWYSYSRSKDIDGIDIFIDICSTDAASYKTDGNKMLLRMKSRLRDYFEYMGDSRESVAKVNRAKTSEELIQIYVKWYYENYLYRHNEQFLDLYEFIISGINSSSDEITEEIKDYFILPFAKLKSDETLYNELSLKEIIVKVTAGISKSTLANLERINSNRYSYKIDLALFCGHLRVNDVLDESRLDRLLSKLPAAEAKLLSNELAELYPSCKTDAKIDLLKYMEENASKMETTYREFLRKAYQNGQKDEVYYGLMANQLNKKFAEMRRYNHV